MSQEFAFLFYPGDYLRDTQCLSEKSQVAYDRIMCEHMRSVPVPKERLDFFIKKLNQNEKDEMFSVLEKINDGFIIPWVVLSIEKRTAYSESRRLNRQKKTSKDMLTHVKTSKDMSNIGMSQEREREREDLIDISVSSRANNVPKVSKRRNFYWDAICAVFGFKGQTVAEKKRIGKLSRDFEIKSPNADQFLEELKSQMIKYRQSMPKMQLTPDAILRHWDSLKDNKIIKSEEERTKKWLNTPNLKEKP